MKKVVIASDSFKGSLSSAQVAQAAEEGVRRVCPECEVVRVPVSDGGEGLVDALVGNLGGKRIYVNVNDPLGRLVRAEYGLVRNSAFGFLSAGCKASGERDREKRISGEEEGMAVIEVAAACGLPLLRPEERNPMKASTYGVGQMIRAALDCGCRRFLVGLGGSATNDGGIGMLSALGCRFRDADGIELPGIGENLSRIVEIDDSQVTSALTNTEFIIACDVRNPFSGPEGAACVFAPQKGADAEMVRALDAGLEHFARIVRKHKGIDLNEIPGSGAAGGLGGAFMAFLGGRMRRGIDIVLDMIHFDELIRGADLVITGEGRIDAQTFMGKTPYGILEHAAAQGVPVVAICGSAASGVAEGMAEAGRVPGTDNCDSADAGVAEASQIPVVISGSVDYESRTLSAGCASRIAKGLDNVVSEFRPRLTESEGYVISGCSSRVGMSSVPSGHDETEPCSHTICFDKPGCESPRFAAIYPVTPASVSLSDAMRPEVARENVARTVERIMRER